MGARLCMASGLGVRVALSYEETVRRLEGKSIDSFGMIQDFIELPLVFGSQNRNCLVQRSQIQTIEPIE